MGRHATTFEKECLCFRCPLEDCRTPCPFGVDKGKSAENVDEYLFNNYVKISFSCYTNHSLKYTLDYGIRFIGSTREYWE